MVYLLEFKILINVFSLFLFMKKSSMAVLYKIAITFPTVCVSLDCEGEETIVIFYVIYTFITWTQ